MKTILLAGDIGGTKTILGMFRTEEGGGVNPLKEERFVNSEYPSFAYILGVFLRDYSHTPDVAVFGVASPIDNNRCVLTNLPWRVDGDEIGRAFNIPMVRLLNDLEATAWGIDWLREGDLHVLNKGRKRAGNVCLLSAGTGLGEAVAFWDGKRLVPSSSEGGHTDFAPRDDLEIELLRYLMRIYGHVSYERVLSGPGLENIYRFLRERAGLAEPEWLKERFKKEGYAPVITDVAIRGGDETCRRTVELFISIYGAEAGNLALKVLATGGVYIGGGIAPRIVGLIKKGRFMASFLDKGRFKDLLSHIPVYVILNERTPLLGALRFAGLLAQDERDKGEGKEDTRL